MHWYPRSVPVDEQRARTISEMQELRARGVKVQPIELRGRTIARSFWGRHWCEHLESFSEYTARLAHGRAYVRNGSVCHLAIEAGGVDAMVVGSAIYPVTIRIRQLGKEAWTAIRAACAGRIGSVRELREGRLTAGVTETITDRGAGLFPQPGEIVSDCECSDRATMCKHAAAALSGVGSRLDDSPELLFLLRGVDEAELIAAAPHAAPSGGDATADALAGDAPGTMLDGGLAAGNGVKAPDAPAPEAPGAPPRIAKKTLTYRPPAPTAGLPPSTPSTLVNGGAQAAGFRPSGELIVRLRERCGCSVTEFADLIQVTATTVRRWETAAGPLNLHARPLEALLALHLEIEKHDG